MSTEDSNAASTTVSTEDSNEASTTVPLEIPTELPNQGETIDTTVVADTDIITDDMMSTTATAEDSNEAPPAPQVDDDMVDVDITLPEITQNHEEILEKFKHLPTLWVPDKTSKICMNNIFRIKGKPSKPRCEAIFSKHLLKQMGKGANRRHHCRLCGLLFCKMCSKNKIMLSSAFKHKKKVRVCDMCNEMSTSSFAPTTPEEMYELRKAAIDNGGIFQALSDVQDDEGETKTSYSSPDSLNEPINESNALKILELEEGATEIEIGKSYKKLMRELHPDKRLRMERQASEEAEFKFDRVQKAYKLLQRDDEEILADEEESEKMETFKKVRRVILLISR